MWRPDSHAIAGTAQRPGLSIYCYGVLAVAQTVGIATAAAVAGLLVGKLIS
jgi:hypothetical protein